MISKKTSRTSLVVSAKMISGPRRNLINLKMIVLERKLKALPTQTLILARKHPIQV